MDPQSVVMQSLAPVTQAAHSLSMWDLFWGASFIIKLIMIGLLLSSVWCWAIIFQKMTRLHALQKAADKFEEAFWSGGSLDDLYERIHKHRLDPFASVFCVAMREWRRSLANGGLTKITSGLNGSLQQRLERSMQITISREMDSLERYMGFLASTGSTAPFVGLFGTVLGIMDSFNSIAAEQNTNLAVVAPGISEALFATAIGLVAAIPAVIAYNKISTELDRYANRLEAFSSEFSAIISRQLEQAS